MIKTVSHCKKHQWLWVENPVSLLTSLLIFIFMFSLGAPARADALDKARRATDTLRSIGVPLGKSAESPAPAPGQGTVPKAQATAQPAPAGFLALSASNMNWNQAKAFCQQQGGRLPLIEGSESLGGIRPRPGSAIDGFGKVDASWRTGVPFDRYWTGTVHSSDPHSAWGVHSDNASTVSPGSPGGKVTASTTPIGYTRRVLCVAGTSTAEPKAKKESKEVKRSFAIFARSDKGMNWDEAVAFCKQRGGRLPLIGGNATMVSTPTVGTPIDGVGNVEGAWPAGFAKNNRFWTGTEEGHTYRSAYDLAQVGDKIRPGMAVKSLARFVVCVR